ncbi:hypothetical protein PoB_000025500 [Plakobranchus ocellatus]|uniref:Uncharacterized protein n=1 Tax=Plakobranchus ocellatus TaxID=259542 RepID=A0AAV3XTC3_9GAST|nr:hypothetical protein PoB_000025500 [Plakobranchus ocellatus]
MSILESSITDFPGCAFGILSNKWRIFHRPLNVSVEFATDIVKAYCILHHCVRQRCEMNFKDMLEITGLDVPETAPEVLHGGRYAQTNRDKFAHYFHSAGGQLPWQWSYA